MKKASHMKKTILLITLIATGLTAALEGCGLSGVRPGAKEAGEDGAVRVPGEGGAVQPVSERTGESGAEAKIRDLASAPVDTTGSVRAGTETGTGAKTETETGTETKTETETETAIKTDAAADDDDYLLHTRNQDRSTQLLIRMGELYGDNPPGVVGFSADSKKCPEFIGGVYLNEEGVLVIQVVGDSATVRRRLEQDLGSKAFIVEPNLRFTQKELLRINEELAKRWNALQNDPVMRNVKSAGVTAHAVEISLVLNSPEKQREFREKVMDSPAFRFTGPTEPVADERVGVNDTLGVYLRPEYEVYATQTSQVKFLLYNRSGGDIFFGAHYSVTYRDGQGVWRELPINDLAIDIGYGLANNEKWEFTASLYPEVHPNPPGDYRFFYRVDIGNVRDVLMMAPFRLTDNEAEWRGAAATPVPEKVRGGLSEEAYREREERILEKKIFTVAEEMPVFAEGGMPGCLAFIADRMPKNLSEEGRVIVEFVVERDGTLSHLRVLRAPHKQLADEAIRLIGAMPPWIPGKQKGRKVRVKYTLPITFRKAADDPSVSARDSRLGE